VIETNTTNDVEKEAKIVQPRKHDYTVLYDTGPPHQLHISRRFSY